VGNGPVGWVDFWGLAGPHEYSYIYDPSESEESCYWTVDVEVPYDAYVSSLGEAMRAALDPNVRTMIVVGEALEYTKEHEETERIRELVRNDIRGILEGHTCSGCDGEVTTHTVPYRGTFSGNYGTMNPLSPRAFTLGTWLLGQNHPEVSGDVSFTKTCRECGKCSYSDVNVDVHWSIRDDLDLEPSATGHSRIYNLAATFFFDPLWHGLLGGRRDAPIHWDWDEEFSLPDGECTPHECNGTESE
jgi:hypothetical protein